MADANAKEEQSMFARKQHAPDTKRVLGIKRTQQVMRTATYTASISFFVCYILGTAYVNYQYGDGFLKRLEEQNRSKRTGFWQRRNDEVSYQTRKTSDVWSMLGLKSWAVTDAADEQ
jgi:hypothetical protein